MPIAAHIEIDKKNQTSSTDSRPDILERIAAGQMGAVDECLAQYGRLVWSLAKKWTRTNADAEDAVQDIFVELWQKADRFDANVGNEATFVATVARRRLIDRLRRAKSTPKIDSMSSNTIEIESVPETDTAEMSEEAAKARRCLGKLSEKHRHVLTLSINQGHTQQAISNRLRLPLGTVKTLARRGLLALKECMNRRESTSHSESSS